jgi:hypothetical protein
MTGFAQFLQNLKNQGMQPTLVGDFPTAEPVNPGASSRPRPYIVK